MKKTILVSTLIILISMQVRAQEAQKVQGEETGEKTHTVKKGDTLWDISDEFLKDPFRWPTIWDQNNRQIKNPHWIYPGQVIIIRPLAEKPEAAPAPEPAKVETVKEAVVAPPKQEEKAPEPAPTAPPAPQKPTYYYAGLGKSSVIVSDGPASSGSIIDAKEGKVMLAYGDEVYVNIGEDKGAKKGDRYTIYKKAVAVYHPVSKKLVGHKVEVLGILEIEKIHDKISEARITASYDAISRGDKLTTFVQIPESVEVKKGESPVEGLVIANARGSVEMGEGDLVYLDRGRSAGVDAGNLFLVSLPGRVTDGYNIPAEDVARLLVLSTQNELSTALVVHVKKSFHVGDKVRMETGR